MQHKIHANHVDQGKVCIRGCHVEQEILISSYLGHNHCSLTLPVLKSTDFSVTRMLVAWIVTMEFLSSASSFWTEMEVNRLGFGNIGMHHAGHNEGPL